MVFPKHAPQSLAQDAAKRGDLLLGGFSKLGSVWYMLRRARIFQVQEDGEAPGVRFFGGRVFKVQSQTQSSIQECMQGMILPELKQTLAVRPGLSQCCFWEKQT